VTLVHCTDGWDRTAQVCGLIQVIVDRSSRTLKGFQELIQKEWCDSGHMFSLRCGYGRRQAGQCAPIFAQFIDAVAQLLAAQPSAFEFTESFLGFLLFHAYAQLYGDFDGCCYDERAARPREPSLWMCLRDADARQRFVNRQFVGQNAELDFGTLP
jgi:hypothetical protein